MNIDGKSCKERIFNKIKAKTKNICHDKKKEEDTRNKYKKKYRNKKQKQRIKSHALIE